MGTPGVPFNIPKIVIVECIKKKKGIVTQICKSLDIAFDTFYKHIASDPDMKEVLDTARNDYDTTLCDMAETALMRALNQSEDLSASLSSAKFVLNNKGKNRGYNPPNGDQIVKITCSELQEKYQNGDIKQPDWRATTERMAS